MVAGDKSRSSCVVPGGGLSLDGSNWVACRPGFFLPVRVLSRRFRTLYLRYLEQPYTTHLACCPSQNSPTDFFDESQLATRKWSQSFSHSEPRRILQIR
jgi:hypothetical protein